MVDSNQIKTISVLVLDHYGVLARLANLFAEKNYNIDALTVASTLREGVSRITIVTHGEDKILENVLSDLSKLEDVLRVSELKEEQFLSAELALLKVETAPDNQGEILRLLKNIGAKVLDEESGAIIAQLSDTPEGNQKAIDQLSQFGVIELVRTGTVAIGKGKSAFFPQESI